MTEGSRVVCPHCAESISTQATTCPHCRLSVGARRASHIRFVKWFAIISAVVLTGCAVMIGEMLG